MAFCTLTTTGKCDVTFTYFNKENSIIAVRNITFDIKPTIIELKNKFKIDGAKRLRLTTTPSCNVKNINL